MKKNKKRSLNDRIHEADNSDINLNIAAISGGLIAAGLLILLSCFLPKKSNGQSRCDRTNYFVIEAALGGNTQHLNSSLRLGLNVPNTNLTVLAGPNAVTLPKVDPKNANQEIRLGLSGGLMYRLKVNGENSRVVHGLLVTGNSLGYAEVGYRLYGAPTPYSLATVGGGVNYSRIHGVTVSFILTGFL